MTDKSILLREIETLPPSIVGEVYDFVAFLKARKMLAREISDITLASEKSLANDWLLPEEDVAWASL